MVLFDLVFKIKGLSLILKVGTEVANTTNEGSFLIPGGRQRQTLSPLLNPAGNRDFLFKIEDTKKEFLNFKYGFTRNPVTP